MVLVHGLHFGPFGEENPHLVKNVCEECVFVCEALVRSRGEESKRLKNQSNLEKSKGCISGIILLLVYFFD